MALHTPEPAFLAESMNPALGYPPLCRRFFGRNIVQPCRLLYGLRGLPLQITSFFHYKRTFEQYRAELMAGRTNFLLLCGGGAGGIESWLRLLKIGGWRQFWWQTSFYN